MGRTVKEMRKKKVFILIGIVVVVAITMLILFLVIMRKETERTLKITEVEGDASITRDDIGKIELYKNMSILSGDSLILNNGILTLKADSDKYIYFDEKTEMSIDISGTKQDSDTDIGLVRGAITCDIRNKLSSESEYTVNTPNVAISANSGMFRVEMYEENELEYTRISVFKGGVHTKLLKKDGTETEEEMLVVGGNEIIICEDEVDAQYVSSPTDLDYSRLPAPVIKRLAKAAGSGRQLSIRKEELEKYLEEKAIVTFKYDDKVYSVESVDKGDVITATPTDPSVSGAWDYNFEKPVTKDMEIEWKQK